VGPHCSTHPYVPGPTTPDVYLGHGPEWTHFVPCWGTGRTNYCISLPFELQNIYYENVLQALMADSPVIIEGVIWVIFILSSYSDPFDHCPLALATLRYTEFLAAAPGLRSSSSDAVGLRVQRRICLVYVLFPYMFFHFWVHVGKDTMHEAHGWKSVSLLHTYTFLRPSVIGFRTDSSYNKQGKLWLLTAAPGLS